MPRDQSGVTVVNKKETLELARILQGPFPPDILHEPDKALLFCELLRGPYNIKYWALRALVGGEEVFREKLKAQAKGYAIQAIGLLRHPSKLCVQFFRSSVDNQCHSLGIDLDRSVIIPLFQCLLIAEITLETFNASLAEIANLRRANHHTIAQYALAYLEGGLELFEQPNQLAVVKALHAGLDFRTLEPSYGVLTKETLRKLLGLEVRNLLEWKDPEIIALNSRLNCFLSPRQK